MKHVDDSCSIICVDVHIMNSLSTYWIVRLITLGNYWGVMPLRLSVSQAKFMWYKCRRKQRPLTRGWFFTFTPLQSNMYCLPFFSHYWSLLHGTWKTILSKCPGIHCRSHLAGAACTKEPHRCVHSVHTKSWFCRIAMVTSWPPRGPFVQVDRLQLVFWAQLRFLTSLKVY